MHGLARLSLWCFVFCVPWQNVIVVSTIGTIARITGYAAAIACTAAILQRGQFRVNAFMILAMLYFALRSLSILWSPYPEHVFQLIKTDLQLAVLIFIVHNFVLQASQIEFLLKAYLFGCLVTVFGTIYALQTNPETDVTYRRFVVSGFNANDAAYIMALGVPMAWHAALATRRWVDRCWFAYVPMAFFAILLTGSRGGFVAALVALTAPFVHGGHMLRRGKVLVLMGLIVVTGISLLGITHYMVPEDTLARISTLTEGKARDDAGGFGGRIPIWIAGVEMFSDSPFIGTGAGTFDEAMGTSYQVELAPHNIFIATAVELGVVGLVLLVALLGRGLSDIAALPTATRRTFYVLMAVLCFPLMLGNWEWQKQTWLLLALATTSATVVGRSSEPVTRHDVNLYTTKRI